MVFSFHAAQSFVPVPIFCFLSTIVLGNILLLWPAIMPGGGATGKQHVGEFSRKDSLCQVTSLSGPLMKHALRSMISSAACAWHDHHFRPALHSDFAGAAYACSAGHILECTHR